MENTLHQPTRKRALLAGRASSDRQSGFTLIEVMIVVAIVAILASIAFPAYQDSVRKGRRAGAQGLLLEIAQREQQYFIDGRTYTTALSDLGVTAPADVSDFYDVTITLQAGPPPGFLVEAVPKTGSVQASDGTISIDRAGRKLPADKW